MRKADATPKSSPGLLRTLPWLIALCSVAAAGYALGRLEAAAQAPETPVSGFVASCAAGPTANSVPPLRNVTARPTVALRTRQPALLASVGGPGVGRSDPFVPLVASEGSSDEPPPQASRNIQLPPPPELAPEANPQQSPTPAPAAAPVTVAGIMGGAEARVAIVKSEGTSYIVGVGEKVGDATVVAISEDNVVFKEAGSTRSVAVSGGQPSAPPSAPMPSPAIAPVAPSVAPAPGGGTSPAAPQTPPPAAPATSPVTPYVVPAPTGGAGPAAPQMPPPAAPATSPVAPSDSPAPPRGGTDPAAPQSHAPVVSPSGAGLRAALPSPVAVGDDKAQSYRVAIGPFYDRTPADTIVERLTHAGFTPSMTVANQDKREAFRVASPPLSPITAERRIAGLSDLHPAREALADGTVRVVFGVFTSEEAAALVKEIRARGYPGPIVEPAGPSYTINLSPTGRAVVDEIVAVVKEVQPQAPMMVGSTP